MSAGPSSGNDALSFAEQLRLKHAEPHTATVEDVVDEEDIQHPPPAMAAVVSPPEPAPGPGTIGEPLSERAKGKRPATEQTSPAPPVQRPVLDTRSEEAFPSLGGGPKPRAAGPTPTWGAKKSHLAADSGLNGVNNSGPPSTPPTSGTSTPLSLPSRSAPSPAQATRPGVAIPGKHTEAIHFKHPQLLKRQELKKPIPEIIRDINRRSKATVTMNQRPDGITFEGTGPVDAVRQSLKDVASQVGSKQSTKVPIPASVRPFVIGSKGAKISEITRLSGARIQVPKSDETPFGNEEDDAIVDVTIEGDAVAAKIALDEIQKIVNERTSTMNVRLRDIPAEFYPFIAGPHNSGLQRLQQGRDVQVNIPHYYSWSQQPPPQTPSQDVIPNFIPHPNRHIQLSGDRMAVQDARNEIERQVEQLRREIVLSQLPISRGQHQFVAGQDGSGLHELLEQTGCAVILPPESDGSEMLYVTGPRANIERGLEEVMTLATSMQMANVNVGHQNDAAHARALTRYLQQRRAIEQLEKAHNSHIVLPSQGDGPTAWEVYSREGKNTIRARTDIMKIAGAYPPSRFRHFDVDPFFHDHLRSNHRERIQRDHGVHLLMPQARGEGPPSLVLVYEGPEAVKAPEISRAAPTSNELAAFEKALLAAEKEILGLSSGHAPITTEAVEVPAKFHDKVRKFVRNDQASLSPEQPPMQVLSSSPASKAATEVLLRGPSDRIGPLAEKVREFVEQEKRDEVERGFTMSFEFPQKHANFLIGKRGENINKLRDEFDVEINVKDGQVELKGPKAKAEACKSRILAMSKKLDDEATHVLKVNPKYHRELIGAKGTQVQRLQDRYNVRVMFPRSTQPANDHDSVVDGSDAGGARPNRPNQAPDEVIVRGPKRGADACREELLSLLQYTIDTSQMATVSVAKKQVPQIIGQGGKEMENIRQATGAKIDIPSGDEPPDAAGRVQLTIKGTKKQVEDAKKLLQEKAKAFDDTVTRSIDVEKKLHKAIIGSGGANIKQIVVDAGGSDDRRELARTVRFPQADSEESTIRIEGRKDVVDKIHAAIANFASAKENEQTESMEIPPHNHKRLIGAGGETRRTLESQFGIRIDIPKQNVQGAARSQVKLTGSADKVAAARAHIETMLREREGETVQVPRAVHHTVSNNGAFFRHLRNAHSVTVDHAGHNPPPRTAESKAASRSVAGGAVPLITDTAPTAPDAHSWVVHDTAAAAGEGAQQGDIPWVLKGKPDDVAAALQQLRAALAEAETHTATGLLILPDPKTYRLVIGPGGQQINAIRAASGCKVTVPKNQAAGEAIEIVGSPEGVEKAKELILVAVQQGGRG